MCNYEPKLLHSVWQLNYSTTADLQSVRVGVVFVPHQPAAYGRRGRHIAPTDLRR